MAPYVANLTNTDEERLLIADLIYRRPKMEMVRTILKSAIEAAVKEPFHQCRIELGVAEIDGRHKLRILNYGSALEESQIRMTCGIAASMTPREGVGDVLSRNVATIPCSHLGVRYRYCEGGIVREVIIGKRKGGYGRVPQYCADEIGSPGDRRLVEVLDVTDKLAGHGYDLSQDWWEAALLGMRPNHDTAFDNQTSNPTWSEHWLTEALYYRFFRVPANVEIHISPDLCWGSLAGPFLPLIQRAATDFTAYECIDTVVGPRVHFFYAPLLHDNSGKKDLSKEYTASELGQFGIVYRDEIYARVSGMTWRQEAPRFGITTGSRKILVFVELPDDYSARQGIDSLTLSQYEGKAVEKVAEDFAALVCGSRPSWLSEAVKSFASRSHDPDNIARNLSKLRGALLRKARYKPDGEIETCLGTRELSGSAFAAEFGFNIALLDDEQEISDRGLLGRAASFDSQNKQLFVNTLYSAIDDVRSGLRKALADVDHTLLLDRQIEKISIDCLTIKLGRTVLRWMLRDLDPQNWSTEQIENAISPEVLSIVADDCLDMLLWAEAEVRARMSGAGEIIG